MGNLDSLKDDKILTQIDKNIVADNLKEKVRGYLGMSAIGNYCVRQLWYRYHFCKRRAMEPKSLRAINDGHAGEALMIKRLKGVKFIKLWSDEDGSQIECNDFDGLFSGHLDGVILGVPVAPKTYHVWEHKQVKVEKFNNLLGLKSTKGEKQALKLWDETYYAQAQMYMHYQKLTRHYITVTTPGGRDMTSCRTEYDKKEALYYIDRADRILKSDRPLEKVSENPEYYQCGEKWCEFREMCHERGFADVNCRTCCHYTIGNNSCAFKKEIKDVNDNCYEHRFLPSLVPYELVNANAEKNWIEYRLDDGTLIRNGEHGYKSFSSAEMQYADGDEETNNLRAELGLTLTSVQKLV